MRHARIVSPLSSPKPRNRIARLVDRLYLGQTKRIVTLLADRRRCASRAALLMRVRGRQRLHTTCIRPVDRHFGRLTTNDDSSESSDSHGCKRNGTAGSADPDFQPNGAPGRRSRRVVCCSFCLFIHWSVDRDLSMFDERSANHEATKSLSKRFLQVSACAAAMRQFVRHKRRCGRLDASASIQLRIYTVEPVGQPVRQSTASYVRGLTSNATAIESH